MTNATLIYLFRPTLHDQTPNPNVPSTPGSAALLNIVRGYDLSPTWQTILPTLIPLAAVALAASHGFIVLRWMVEGVAERLLWRGSAEEVEVEKMRARHTGQTKRDLEKLGGKQRGEEEEVGGFWSGGEDGARAIARVGKAE